MTAEEYFAVSVERDFTELIDGVIVVDEPFLHVELELSSSKSARCARAFDLTSDRLTSPQLPGFSLPVERLFVR
jgi:hypothetical protein